MVKIIFFIIFVLIISCKTNERDSKKIELNEKKINKILFKDTIINIKLNFYTLELESKYFISDSFFNCYYNQTINFYKNGNLLKTIKFLTPTNDSIKINNIFYKYLSCHISMISTICSVKDTLYFISGGGYEKQTEYGAYYSLSGELVFCSLSNWDGIIYKEGDLKKLKKIIGIDINLFNNFKCNEISIN